MRLITRSIMVASALLTAIGCAAPMAASSITERRPNVCTNAPSTIPGSTYNPRDLLSSKVRHSRGNPISTYWCAPNSQTYVVFQAAAIKSMTGPAVPQLLLNLFNQLSRRIQRGGDNVISGGVYRWGPGGPGALAASFMNVNNHQLTYGVVCSAVAAVKGYMASDGDYGLMSFDIWDGDNQVGNGVIGYMP